MRATFEGNGQATPEFRAAILGELLRLISVQLAVVPYREALAHIMKVSDCTEEQVGGDVARSWFLLEKGGLIVTNTIRLIGERTNAVPSPLITDYVSEGEGSASDDEEEAQ